MDFWTQTSSGSTILSTHNHIILRTKGLMICLALERFLQGNTNFKCLTGGILLWKQGHLFKGDYLPGGCFGKLWGFENFRVYRCFGETFTIWLLVTFTRASVQKSKEEYGTQNSISVHLSFLSYKAASSTNPSSCCEDKIGK